MPRPAISALIACQVLAVLFIAVHDWIPLGKLNNLAGIHAVDSRAKLFFTTVWSTLPFALVLAASAYYAPVGFPNWLIIWLWATYAACLYGVLRAWYLPYLFGGDPARAARYQTRFADTHAFLPVRNGIRPDTLHVCFHVLVLGVLILLAVVTFSGHGAG